MNPQGEARSVHGLIDSELRLAGRLDTRFFALLQALHDCGSLRQAARAAGYTYKGAWLVLDAANALANEPLVSTERSGSRLTPAGLALLGFWRDLSAHHAHLMQQLASTHEAALAQHPHLTHLLRRMRMKTSARNQFVATVTALISGPVTTEVQAALPGGQELVAHLGSAAAKQLKLRKGTEVVALIKASEVVLVHDLAGFTLAAGNQLAGTVSRVSKGAVSSLVGVTLPGGQVITATITNDAAEALTLKVGQPTTAVFAESAVLLAVS